MTLAIRNQEFVINNLFNFKIIFQNLVSNQFECLIFYQEMIWSSIILLFTLVSHILTYHNLPSDLPKYLPTYLPTYLPSHLHSHLLAHLPTYLPT